MTCPSLPDGFETLEPFAARWAISGTAERAALRADSSPAEREAFFNAGFALVERALEYLDARALPALSPGEERLMNLLLSLAHVAQAVETQGPDEPKGTASRARMLITRSAADG